MREGSSRARLGTTSAFALSLGAHALLFAAFAGWTTLQFAAGDEPASASIVAATRAPDEPAPDLEPVEAEPQVPEPRDLADAAPELVELPEANAPPAELPHFALVPSARAKLLPQNLEPRPRPSSEPARVETPAAAPPAAPAAPTSTTVRASGPSLLLGPPPSYPRASVRLNEEGEVLCRLHLDARGAVLRVEVLESSGFARLDAAAVAALASWSFEPALEDGAAVPSEYDHRVVFELTDAR